MTDPIALLRSAALSTDPTPARPIRVLRPSVARLIGACLVAGAAWIVAEAAGGLFFLALGVGLWRYELLPLLWAITSAVVWLFALSLIVPLSKIRGTLCSAGQYGLDVGAAEGAHHPPGHLPGWFPGLR